MAFSPDFGADMASLLWGLIVVLVLLWLLGFFVGNLGNIVHLLLVLALIVLVWNLFMGRRARI
jgi:hypothetical protein